MEFYDAIMNNDIERVKQLIKKKVDVNIKYGSWRGSTPLSTAIMEQKKEIIVLLINAGVDLSFERGYDKQTYLFTTMNTEHEEICLLLIKKGINLNVKNKYGGIPLIVACLNGLEKVCLELIKKGIDVNEKGPYDQSPLTITIKEDMPTVFSALIKNGANTHVSVELWNGSLQKIEMSLLKYTVLKDRKKMCCQLMEKGLYGIKELPSSLLFTSENNAHFSMTQMLISCGVDFSETHTRIQQERIREIPTFRTLLIQYVKNDRNINIDELIGIVPDEILEDIENKWFGFCLKCHKYFYYFKYKINLLRETGKKEIDIETVCLCCSN